MILFLFLFFLFHSNLIRVAFYAAFDMFNPVDSFATDNEREGQEMTETEKPITSFPSVVSR